ncbi:hypothetical protein Tco_0583585 [Tanacetum coccineum]
MRYLLHKLIKLLSRQPLIVVEKEIGRHAADGLGRVDYAVASGGASVKKHSEAYVGGSGTSRVTEWLKGGSVRGFGEGVAAEFWAAG